MQLSAIRFPILVSVVSVAAFLFGGVSSSWAENVTSGEAAFASVPSRDLCYTREAVPG